MNYPHRASPARLDRSCCPDLPPRLVANTDQERAPITFGWWAYTPGDRVSKHFHLETIYRLDKVGGCGTAAVTLIPSPFYGMTEEQLRRHMLVRQAALLPKLPAGYRWIGPQLVEDVAPTSAVSTMRTAGTSNTVPECVHGLARGERLLLAQRIATQVLASRSAHA